MCSFELYHIFHVLVSFLFMKKVRERERTSESQSQRVRHPEKRREGRKRENIYILTELLLSFILFTTLLLTTHSQIQTCIS